MKKIRKIIYMVMLLIIAQRSVTMETTSKKPAQYFYIRSFNEFRLTGILKSSLNKYEEKKLMQSIFYPSLKIKTNHTLKIKTNHNMQNIHQYLKRSSILLCRKYTNNIINKYNKLTQSSILFNQRTKSQILPSFSKDSRKSSGNDSSKIANSTEYGVTQSTQSTSNSRKDSEKSDSTKTTNTTTTNSLNDQIIKESSLLPIQTVESIAQNVIQKQEAISKANYILTINIASQDIEKAIETIKNAAKNKLYIMERFYPNPLEKPLALKEVQSFIKQENNTSLLLFQNLCNSEKVKSDFNNQEIIVNSSDTKNFVIIKGIIDNTMTRIYSTLNFNESSLIENRNKYAESNNCSIYMKKYLQSLSATQANKKLTGILTQYVSPIDNMIMQNIKQKNDKNKLKEFLNGLYSAIICSEILCEQEFENIKLSNR